MTKLIRDILKAWAVLEGQSTPVDLIKRAVWTYKNKDNDNPQKMNKE